MEALVPVHHNTCHEPDVDAFDTFDQQPRRIPDQDQEEKQLDQD